MEGRVLLADLEVEVGEDLEAHFTFDLVFWKRFCDTSLRGALLSAFYEMS